MIYNKIKKLLLWATMFWFIYLFFGFVSTSAFAWDFTTTWKVGTSGYGNATNEIRFTVFAGTASTVDWWDGITGSIAVGTQTLTHTYTGAWDKTVKISWDLKHFYNATITDDHFGKLISVDDRWGMSWDDMSNMFALASNLTTIPAIAPNLSNVTNLSNMFWNASLFNQPLSGWDVSNVTDMSYMFIGAWVFNQPLSGWDVSNVTNMLGMFQGASSFNQPLNSWDVSNVTNMKNMFYAAAIFNQPLNNWDVSHVTNTQGMFKNALAFNQDLHCWNVATNPSHIEFEFWSALITGNIPQRWVSGACTPPAPTPTPVSFGWWWGGSSIVILSNDIDNETPSSNVDQNIFNPTIDPDTCFAPMDILAVDQWGMTQDQKIAHQMLYSFGLTTMTGTVDFWSDRKLTRAEAAKFLVQFAQNVLCRDKINTYDNRFVDISNSHPDLQTNIKLAYEYGIFYGSEWWLFRPDDFITRDEIVATMIRLITNKYDDIVTRTCCDSDSDGLLDDSVCDRNGGTDCDGLPDAMPPTVENEIGITSAKTTSCGSSSGVKIRHISSPQSIDDWSYSAKVKQGGVVRWSIAINNGCSFRSSNSSGNEDRCNTDCDDTHIPDADDDGVCDRSNTDCDASDDYDRADNYKRTLNRLTQNKFIWRTWGGCSGGGTCDTTRWIVMEILYDLYRNNTYTLWEVWYTAWN